MKSKNTESGKNVLIVAGEASGDNLGSSIMEEWKKQENVRFFGTGGSKMEKSGAEILYNIHDLEVIGFSGVVRKYRYLKKTIARLALEARNRNVRTAVLIDYPGFNLRLAAELKQYGILSYAVVSPQIWAWNYSRVEKIRQFFHSVLCLYPFEIKIYEKENISAHFIGHPLAEEIRNFIAAKKQATGIEKKKQGKTVALLPGSRTREIESLLPVMSQLAALYREKYPDTRFILTSPNPRAYQMEIPDFIEKTRESSHEVIYRSDAAVACSGTVTLELALFGVPYFLLYKTSFLNYVIFKRLIKIPYIGIANVIAGKFIVREFLQKNLDAMSMLPELEAILRDKKYIQEMKDTFTGIRKELGHFSSARKAANIMSKGL